MRLSLVLLAVALGGVLAGGWMTGRLGFGLCVIFDSVCVGAWALFHDDGTGREPEAVRGAPTLVDVLDRSRRAG